MGDCSKYNPSEGLEIKQEAVCEITDTRLKSEESLVMSDEELEPTHRVYIKTELIIDDDDNVDQDNPDSLSSDWKTGQVSPVEENLVVQPDIDFICSENDSVKIEVNEEVLFQEIKDPLAFDAGNNISVEDRQDSVFTCELCNRCYTSPMYLDSHRKLCRGKKCAERVQPNMIPSDVHELSTVIDGKRTYNCPVCQYKTSHCGSMKYHLVTHTGQRPYSCDECGKRFTLASYLTTHKLVHSDDKLFKCNECTYSCNRAGDLQRHLRRRHSGEKVFACPHCDYKTADSSNLTQHSHTHSGVRPYSCSHCGYRCKLKVTLTNHIRTHTGERPFSCDVCGKGFARVGHLTRHKLIHSGDKPYKCTECPYSCYRASHLQSHMSSRHRGAGNVHLSTLV